MQITWQGWAILSAAFAAATAILAKVGVDSLPPAFATVVRTAVILVIVVGVWLAQGAAVGAGSPPPRIVGALVASGAATGLSWLCYFQALKLGEASRVAPLDKLSVVLVVVFAAVFLGERLDVRGWTGVALIAAGALLVATRR
ncbi:MAG: EamA family transporter [Phenylobacterium sp.]|uniref:EamA family transporter n=1 Tax=Phenylobacterium sp. TaxID=1871053 RepID=UPI0012112D47|nr:EamA family transporter [Phenylobacterium sp.]TAJ68853.1 MAG: EamA family transporter [Phenylobacterium sp.]